MNLTSILVRFGLIIPAIVFHEVAHGYAALMLGDTTARDRGRLSLNPLKHIDPFGTVILPLLLTAVAGVGFGYAKPVPVNPARFVGDRRRGMFLTGIAGPSANLVMAVLGGLIVRLMGEPTTDLMFWIWYGIISFVLVNLALLFFNLIPLPPLDGSRVLPLFLSDRAMVAYHKWEQYGFIILFGIVWLSPRILGFDVLNVYFDYTVYPLFRLFTGIGL